MPQAIVSALEATSFEDAIRLVVSLEGDTDTQAAIAGGIAEARFGVHDDIKAATSTGNLYTPVEMAGIAIELKPCSSAEVIMF